MRFALDIAGFVSYSNIITIITLFEWYGLSDASCSLSVLSEWKIMIILRVWDNAHYNNADWDNYSPGSIDC